MNNEILKEVSTRVAQANNVLVAVSRNPSVDQLSAAVGLTLLLNKLGKHATTVFSGVVPPTLEFLQPEQAIEKTTDSLRDFIIALDKSKADKLRYKVEDDVVRIFITPYKTTISDSDLDFSLGEFNVDVVIAIGISRRDDVDQAVTAHGRILHDATVLALTNKESSDFGAINWNEPQASSVSEMVTAVAYQLSAEKIDGQMATALLTGIISETDRFRNESTTPQSLDFASRLMRAGANQQLIADELEAAVKLQQAEAMSDAEELPQPHDAYNIPQPIDHKEDDGSLQIDHEEEEPQKQEPDVDNIHIDHQGNLSNGETGSDDAPPQPEFDTSEDDNKQDTYLRSEEDTSQDESLFNLESQEDNQSNDHEDKTLTHGKTINPLHEPEYPARPSEPFDAQKAIEEMQAEQGEQPEAPSHPLNGADEAYNQLEQPPKPESFEQPKQSLPQQPPAPVFEMPEQPPQAEAPEQPHEQTLEELEEAVNSPHVEQQVSDGVPQPLETPEPDQQTPPAPQEPYNDSPPQQQVDMNTIPQPLTGDEDQAKDAPPPVPPPMQPQYFDNNSSGQ